MTFTSHMSRVVEELASAVWSNEGKVTMSNDIPHDLAIKEANWAMKENAECAAAHQRRKAAKAEMEAATGREIPAARAAFAVADAAWQRITMEAFNRTMAERGFPQEEPSGVRAVA